MKTAIEILEQFPRNVIPADREQSNAFQEKHILAAMQLYANQFTRVPTEEMQKDFSFDDLEVWGSNSGDTGEVINYPEPGDVSINLRHKPSGKTGYVQLNDTVAERNVQPRAPSREEAEKVMQDGILDWNLNKRSVREKYSMAQYLTTAMIKLFANSRASQEAETTPASSYNMKIERGAKALTISAGTKEACQIIKDTRYPDWNIKDEYEITYNELNERKSPQGCNCEPEIKTGNTQICCCNICGQPDEKFWKNTK